MPCERSHSSLAESSQFDVMKSRHSSAAVGVELASHGLAGAGYLARGLQGLAGPQQRLRRDAGPVVALAADQAALDDRDVEAAVDQAAGAVLAGGTSADDDDVVVAHSSARESPSS